MYLQYTFGWIKFSFIKQIHIMVSWAIVLCVTFHIILHQIKSCDVDADHFTSST